MAHDDHEAAALDGKESSTTASDMSMPSEASLQVEARDIDAGNDHLNHSSTWAAIIITARKDYAQLETSPTFDEDIQRLKTILAQYIARIENDPRAKAELDLYLFVMDSELRRAQDEADARRVEHDAKVADLTAELEELGEELRARKEAMEAEQRKWFMEYAERMMAPKRRMMDATSERSTGQIDAGKEGGQKDDMGRQEADFKENTSSK